MSQVMKKMIGVVIVMVAFLYHGEAAQAKEERFIKDGIFIENMDVSGMTESEAFDLVQSYVESLKELTVTLNGKEDKNVTVTTGELGLSWTNPEVINQAAELGQNGNVVERYKTKKDLAHENYIYQIDMEVSRESIKNFIEENTSVFNQKVINAKLVRENSSFRVIDGKSGYQVDTIASENALYKLLSDGWNHQEATMDLVIVEEKPLGSAEELGVVKDVIGTYTTSFPSSSSARVENIRNGAGLINGTTVYPGETFSMFDHILPFTVGNGYYMAGSYLNGAVVDSLGGGICQVSSTLYNAALTAEMEITQRYNHSMIVSYVPPAMDAAIAESAGKDFTFVNATDYPIYIEGITWPDKRVTFNIYGKETRPANRSVTFESEIIEVIQPTSENIVQTTTQPLGFIQVQSVHVGYKSKLWKIVKVDGKEVSRTAVNSSNYSMVPRTATVGVSTENGEAYNQLQAAIATGSIDQVKAVSDHWAAVNAQTAAQQAQEAAQQAEQQQQLDAAPQPEPQPE